jgi:hypothetical protein
MRQGAGGGRGECCYCHVSLVVPWEASGHMAVAGGTTDGEGKKSPFSTPRIIVLLGTSHIPFFVHV